MLSIKNVIHTINKALGPFFIKGEGGNFVLSAYKSSGTYRLTVSEFSSDAYNDYGNDGETVKVVKWFSDYWLFVELNFKYPKGVLLTVSVFQGEEDDNYKNQLFRAEWDDYGDNNMNHPQPHWHFLRNRNIDDTVSDFVEFVSSEFGDSFTDMIAEEKRRSVDLSKFHFAMNADWNNTDRHIHLIDNEKTLGRWFGGLLAYLRTELKFIDSRRGM
ncbi:hypothetical protein SMI01S_15990 [Sphingobacterium mizutaii NBRC 14946 = DSM 11724]|uniref:Uncharacterized protein n=2 Tax=Sphingobacterium mizutaii TaxID=1010 RepID=A0AAJ4X8M3_9SPHI|nr:hypothetical protein [Sphingobacterium mizutaii]GEM67993.1 hypothetical protein SMI01S_15990 [Sphingobacterium mizutaii NBRC 14946 = DSM 11724]SDL78965.1 hypothetical protein SAMN05192578_10991 [Sphingobacterium mizutaii]SNV37511.1 Uncharacterised protein [Sphingobacterium mizutaii]